jgi:hypothetical protein
MDPLAARFILPLYSLFAVCGGGFVARMQWFSQRSWIPIAMLMLWGGFYTIPFSLKAVATSHMLTSRVDEAMLAMAGKNEVKVNLYCTFSPVHMITEGFAAVPQEEIVDSPVRFVRLLRAGLYNAVFIFESYDVDSSTSEWRSRNGLRLDGLITEVVGSEMATSAVGIRMYRLLGYKDSAGRRIDTNSSPEELGLRTAFRSSEEVGLYLRTLYP